VHADIDFLLISVLGDLLSPRFSDYADARRYVCRMSTSRGSEAFVPRGFDTWFVPFRLIGPKVCAVECKNRRASHDDNAGHNLRAPELSQLSSWQL